MPIPHAKRKEYMAAYIRKHYSDNKQYYVDKAAERKKKILAYIREAKDKPCTDCGVKYAPFVMEFDHITKDKVLDLAGVASRGWSIKRIDLEIAKCEVVCANCHRIRTYSRSLTERHLASN